MASSVVFVALALFAAATAAPEQRVVGGEPAIIENYPYVVALTYTYPSAGITVQRCVGCLLSSYHVLTTAYCFTDANQDNIMVRAGSTNSMSGGFLVRLGLVNKHPNYVQTPRNDDIAVATLATPLSFSATVGMLYLPAYDTYIPEGTPTTVVSWGFEYSEGPQLEILKTIELNTIGIDECQNIYSDLEDEVEISDNVICASAPGKGMCVGDSGAPMVGEETVFGISSFMHECGNDDLPDIFTRVDRYTPWIVEVAV